MKHMIYTLIFSLTLCNVAWAQFGNGTEGQTDLIVRPDKPEPVKQEPVKKKKVQTPTQKREPVQSAESELWTQHNFQTFVFDTSNATSPVQLDTPMSTIPFNVASDFGVFEHFVSSSSFVTQSPITSVHKDEGASVIWFYQEQTMVDISGRSTKATVKAFGIDFIRAEWAETFARASENNSVAFFFTKPSEIGALIPMHKVLVVETKKKEVFFLSSLMSLISDGYKEAGMPYAQGQKLVDAFYEHIIMLTNQFDDTDICDMFSDSDYDINKSIEDQPENIKNIGRIYPQTYSIFSEASDYVHNNDYYFGDENGIISRVDQQCSLTALWNEFFYYIFIHGL